ncbi:SIR2 family protein [Clostridium sp. CCUG 7971]|uniref:SIR2 family protein n=1 Tax=Clostridium sp. CCUG 7971 TaxID=2811414 RepID=UPI001ABA7103|nr:SIR2 family protein [Clostridium sp. CCUG 7971]MBO3445862.1 SIR2 family protein [Clostridium sp. CCUG 7971]
MKISIFLGAGASAAENLPIQNELFSEYFKKLKQDDFKSDMNMELYKFFKQMFNIDIIKDDMEKAEFPTFEEVLGLLDLAEQRRECFRNFGLENLSKRSDSIRFLRQYIILLMAKAIHKSERSNNYHKLLAKNLLKENLLTDTTFISANYDIHIDNALASLYKKENPIMLDYGVRFTNFNIENKWVPPKDPLVKLYKIHGSLNWLYCPVCSSLTLTPYDEGIMKLLSEIEEVKCLECRSLTVPIIVPPTYFKNMDNVFLSTIWNKVESSLRESDLVVFCGYSFPDADIHIKYMLKRIQTNRNTQLKFIVFNYHKGKKDESMKREEDRYKRFLGKDVIFTKNSFEDFSANPIKFINDSLKT